MVYIIGTMKEITGFDGYFITEDGRVWSQKQKWIARHGHFKPSNKWLKPIFCGRGYKNVFLWKEKVGIRKRIHRLVAVAFIPNPNNFKEVNHKNGDKGDNRVENLEWCSHKDNIRHAHRTGLCNVKPKIDIETVNKIFEMYKADNTLYYISKIVGVDRGYICRIVNGKAKAWRHIFTRNLSGISPTQGVS